jgi:hypothetical protein
VRGAPGFGFGFKPAADYRLRSLLVGLSQAGRQACQPATKRAFKKALEKAPAEEIIAGAVRYASDPVRLAQSRGPEGDRFTKSPANWLDDERWTDKLAVGRAIDEHGNPIAVPQQQAGIEDDDDIIARTMRDYPDGGQRWH